MEYLFKVKGRAKLNEISKFKESMSNLGFYSSGNYSGKLSNGLFEFNLDYLVNEEKVEIFSCCVCSVELGESSRIESIINEESGQEFKMLQPLAQE